MACKWGRRAVQSGVCLLLVACVTAQNAPADSWRSQLDRMAPPSHMAVGVCAPQPEPIGPRGTETFRWANPRPQGDNLLSVWGSGPRNIWAVGDKGRILHFDGIRWQLADTEAADYLAGVWADPSGQVFVTGYNGRILHFDGTRWYNHPTGVSNDFNGIWGSGPDDVFTVADRGVIFHWDGHCWKRQNSGTENLFFGVWGTGPTDVWAVGGRGNVAHYNGMAWRPVKVGVQAHFVSVWGSGDHVYLAGNDGILLHRTGTTGDWQREDLNTTELLRWIWGSGPDDVWVAGDNGVVRHFDGSGWRAIDIGNHQAVRGGWRMVDGDRPGHTVIVGDDGLLMAGTGTELLPSRKAPYGDLLAVSGNWAVGSNGTVMFRGGGDEWFATDIGTHRTLTAVAELAGGRVLIAGGPELWVGDKSGWRTLDNPLNEPVRAIRAWGADAIAVTDLGTLMRFDGNGWQPFSGPMDGTTETPETLRAGTANGPGAPALFGLAGHGPDDFWLVGPAGRAFWYNGHKWINRSLPEKDAEDLTAVTASGIAVGMGGGVHRWTGDGWRRLTPAGGLLSLYAVVDGPDGTSWAGGDFGTILAIKGRQITRHTRITGQNIWGAAVADNGRLQLVGDGAMILERPRPGGVKIKKGI